MTNNQLEEQVRDWLINHYTNNDVRLSQQVKAQMIGEYPTLTDEAHPSRIQIEALCQRESSLKREQKYFSPPSGPPSAEEALVDRPLRYHYQDLISLMSTEIARREAKIENNEQMQEIWGNSLVTALLVNPTDEYLRLFYPNEGMRRLELIYRRVKLNYNWSDTRPLPLEQQFFVRFIDTELEYLRSVQDSAVPRVPDAKQKAEVYLKSVLGLNRSDDK